MVDVNRNDQPPVILQACKAESRWGGKTIELDGENKWSLDGSPLFLFKITCCLLLLPQTLVIIKDISLPS